MIPDVVSVEPTKGCRVRVKFDDGTVGEVDIGHLHWPELDVDLHVDSIIHPERYPLVAAAAEPERRP
jgi:hypothetical protein